MATETSFDIAPLSTETWPAFEGLVERHNGIFGGCWCTHFLSGCAEGEPRYESSRALKKAYVEQRRTHAALVMDGDEAIA